MLYYLHFSFDGTFETRLGRYVNDSCQAFVNCKIKSVSVDKSMHLCLFVAVDKIPSGTELRYCYGETGLQWRQVFIFAVSTPDIFELKILLTLDIYISLAMKDNL